MSIRKGNPQRVEVEIKEGDARVCIDGHPISNVSKLGIKPLDEDLQEFEVTIVIRIAGDEVRYAVAQNEYPELSVGE